MSSGVVVILVLIAALVLLGLLLRRFVDWVGFPCQFCNSRLTVFDELPADDQGNILAYFREHESRDPNTDAVFVCQNCRVVFDDLSGTKKSRDRDAPTTGIFCKVCSAFMVPCVLTEEPLTCSRCNTSYKWQDYKGAGYLFFTPPRGAEIKGNLTDKDDAFLEDTRHRIAAAERLDDM